MNVCGTVKRPTLNFVGESICKDVGRRVVLARLGMSTYYSKPDDIQWCHECGRYYNPKTPHECNAKRVNENRESLERFLKRFKVKEES